MFHEYGITYLNSKNACFDFSLFHDIRTLNNSTQKKFRALKFSCDSNVRNQTHNILHDDVRKEAKRNFLIILVRTYNCSYKILRSIRCHQGVLKSCWNFISFKGGIRNDGMKLRNDGIE